MSNFKVVFSLKQHTPIIHFQSSQKGATLRATELKPKLDRFLMEHAFGNDKSQYKDFLVSGKEKAFDYKVTISQDLSKSEDIETINYKGKEDKNPLYFGNMGDGEKKKFKKNPQPIKVTFFTFKKDLLGILEEYFEAFLANTNFGTRQSKGFGSFYLTKPFDMNLIKYKTYNFSSNSNNWEKDIKDFYSFLRQGINLPKGNDTRFYTKPAIFLYMKQKNLTWDKKAIKAHYFKTYLEEQKDEHQDKDNCVNFEGTEQYIVRDLFGLSVSQEWKKPYYKSIEKEDVQKDKNKKPIIQRFKSPITFKVIMTSSGVDIYFWADNSVNDILNQEFIIKIVDKGRVQKDDLKLKTLQSFSFQEFFDFTFNLDLSKVVENKYQNQPEYTKLVRIFKEIKENK